MDYLSRLWHTSLRTEKLLEKGENKASLNVPDISSRLPIEFRVGDARYVANTWAKALPTAHDGNASLATFIPIRDDEKVDAKFLKEKIHGFRSADDVFRMDFLQGIVFAVESEDKRKDLVPTEAIALLEAWGNEWLEVQVIGDGASVPALGAGVYLAFQRRLFEAYRLYDDYQGAFLTPLLPGLQDDHRRLEIAGVYMGANAVAVPTRLRFKVGSKLLAGLRIAVKDNFHIKGIRTSMCNKAYYELYPPNTQTARCIADLENAGASILGTTKLAAFAATEEPLECVDYQAPWNPRGDGYQSPAGSSSGSGVAIASYEWLDIAIGSDTSGSGRRPAHWNGCFALRPSHGAVASQGLVPSFPQFDTPTFFARGIDKCRDFAAAWYGEKLGREMDLPLRLIVPTDYLRLITNTDQVRIIDQFVADLGKALDTDPKILSFEEVWQSSPPADSNGESLQEYMRDSCRNSFFFDDFHNLDTFREDHRAKFSRVPYVSPPVRWQWDLSDKITRGERDEAVRRLAVFKAWFADEVMQEGRKMTLVVFAHREHVAQVQRSSHDKLQSRGCTDALLVSDNRWARTSGTCGSCPIRFEGIRKPGVPSCGSLTPFNYWDGLEAPRHSQALSGKVRPPNRSCYRQDYVLARYEASEGWKASWFSSRQSVAVGQLRRKGMGMTGSVPSDGDWEGQGELINGMFPLDLTRYHVACREAFR